jgi:hypothetical protein
LLWNFGGSDGLGGGLGYCLAVSCINDLLASLDATKKDYIIVASNRALFVYLLAFMGQNIRVVVI